MILLYLKCDYYIHKTWLPADYWKSWSYKHFREILCLILIIIKLYKVIIAFAVKTNQESKDFVRPGSLSISHYPMFKSIPYFDPLTESTERINLHYFGGKQEFGYLASGIDLILPMNKIIEDDFRSKQNKNQIANFIYTYLYQYNFISSFTTKFMIICIDF